MTPTRSGPPVHVVLLGDSVIDNGRYLLQSKGELSVDKQLLKRCIDRGWDMTMLAQDGSMLEDIKLRQLPLIPETATHLVLSISGNDLLVLLNEMVNSNFSMRSIYTALALGMTRVIDSYRDLLRTLKSTGRKITVCTIYRPNFEHFFFKGLAMMSLGLHNSRIRAMTVEMDISVIDIAKIHVDPVDFANPLELSTLGGSKLVENICLFVEDFHGLPPEVRQGANLSGITYADDDLLLPAGPCRMGASPMCCASRAPTRKVYCNTEVAPDLLDADFKVARLGPLGPWSDPTEFADCSQPWRET